jgi:hypothetical protein
MSKLKFHNLNIVIHSILCDVCGSWIKTRATISTIIIIRMLKSREMRWAGYIAQIGKLNAYRIFVGKPEGKRPLGGPRRR